MDLKTTSQGAFQREHGRNSRLYTTPPVSDCGIDGYFSQ